MQHQSNLNIIKNYYQIFLKNPEDLEVKWRIFFEDLDSEASDFLTNNSFNIEQKTKQNSTQDYQENEYTTNSLRARLLIRAYRIAGHLKADLDPLNLTEKKYIPDLDPSTYGLTEAEMEKQVFVDGVFGIQEIRLDELIKILEKYYCGKIGTQFMHIQDKEQRDWIMDKIENIKPEEIFTDKGKKAILERLTAAEFFETFLDKKYTGTKRFGLEGGRVTHSSFRTNS